MARHLRFPKSPCDRVVWTLSTEGDFLFKSSLRKKDPYNTRFLCDLILRHSVIAWMAVNNGLYTLALYAGPRSGTQGYIYYNYIFYIRKLPMDGDRTKGRDLRDTAK